MYTNTHLDSILGLLDGRFLGLVTALTDWRAGTVTEANYTGYGTRPAITFGTATNTSPVGGRQRANSATVTLPQNTGSAQTVIGWGLWDADTAGTLRGFYPFDSGSAVVGVAETAGEDIYAAAHGFTAGQRVYVLQTAGSVMPGNLSANTMLWVISAGLTTNSFRVSTTEGGSAVDITSWGSALFIPMTPLEIGNGVTPRFDPGALVIQAY
jgi:hypothetical protein